MKRCLATLLAVSSLLVMGSLALAASDDTSFSIAPPPLAYPDYAAPGTVQHKVGATYVSVSVGDFDLTGIGGTYTARFVRDKTAEGLGQALSLNVGVFILNGSGGGLDVSGILETVGGNYEREVLNENGKNVIVFAGPSYTIGYVYADGGGFEVEAYTALLGLNAGAQLSVTSGDLRISPWAMFSTYSGSTSATVSTSAGSSTTDSDASMTTLSLGIDVLHVPSNFTLSGLLQNSSGDSNAKVTILQFSYTFGGPKGATANAPSPATRARPVAMMN